jgi:hypothetical protein
VSFGARSVKVADSGGVRLHEGGDRMGLTDTRTAGSWFASTDRFADPEGALRIALFTDLLGRFRRGRLVDLGAGHGIFARVAADLGWEVTAVDARDERFPDDPRVTWVRSDVRACVGQELDADVVACLGLWYHLTLADQLALAACCAPRPLILDTHLGMPSDDDHPLHHRRLSRLRTLDGFQGRLYSEQQGGVRGTAAFGNDQSFWPTAASLERQLLEAGYDVVEQVSPAVATDRRFYVARVLGTAGRGRVDAAVCRYIDLAAARG